MNTLDTLSKVTIKDLKGQLNENDKSIEVKSTDIKGDMITEKVVITTTPCNYGGVRYWFICNECNERATVLYNHNSKHKCTRCTGLPYKSQMQQQRDRIIDRIIEIRRRLKWNDDINSGHGAKPKGIWHSTYYRLMSEHDNLLNVIQDDCKNDMRMAV